MRKRDLQFQDYMAQLFKIPEGKSAAKVVTFQVTDACSLRCTYCYQINKGTHVMDFETAKKFIEIILHDNGYLDSNNSEGVVIEFIGGEPFLEIELIDKITSYFIQRMIELNHPWATKFRLSICSNGVAYFNPKVQEYIKKYFRILSFSISIDGNKELHDSCRVFPDGSGSYDIAMAGVKHYTQVLGGPMGSKMTIAPQNITHIYEAVISLIDNGYTDINLNCVYEKGWTLSHAKILYEQLTKLGQYIVKNNLLETHRFSIFEEDAFFKPKKEGDDKNWCGGANSMISVDYKGDIYPCIRYMESSLGGDIKPIIIGNVDRGLFSTLEEKNWEKCLSCVTRRTQNNDLCYYCPIAAGCSNCLAYDYQNCGSFERRATYICIMHIARALANSKLYNEYYLTNGIKKTFEINVPEEWALEIISEDEWNYLKWLEKGYKYFI